ncbi:putative serine/threonine-protein kinase PIX7, partial [Mucuna pruriens]
MGSIAGINVGTTSERKSKGRRNNKDVVQGTTREGSSFWSKIGMLLGCMPLNSKRRGSSSDKRKQAREVTKDTIRRHQPGTSRSSSSKRSRSYARSCSPNINQELLIASSLLRRFTFNDLQLATRTFKAENFLGEGGFGIVLKGWVSKNGNYAARPGMGIPVAVKSLNIHEFQDLKEWLGEISYLSELHHPNLVKLIGFCIEDDKRLLVHECMSEGSLDKHLFRTENVNLPWSIRMKIAIGAAKGLAFLHEEASSPVIFRDFKTSNILLDENYNAKLYDFGLAEDALEGDASHVSTRVMEQGYAAPEYAMAGHLTSKSNVYGFGVILLELLTGRRAVEKRMPREEQNLVEWLRPLLRNKENFNNLMDPRLEGQYSVKGAHKAMRLAIHCVRSNPKARPLMSEVVRVLTSLPIHDDMDGHPGPSTSLQRMHVGPSSSNYGANKHSLETAPAQNLPWHFHDSPLSQDYPLPPPTPRFGQP